MDINEHQFHEMHRQLKEGGFTYDPRKRTFVTKGYSVAAHPSAELRVPGGASLTHLHGYVAGSAPVWSQTMGQHRGQEMIGGWHSPEGEDVLDIPKVFPVTPHGHEKSRRAQVLRKQQASFVLHTGEEDVNPWFPGNAAAEPPQAPGRMAKNFPEFGALAANKPRVALDPEKYPEIEHWASAPTRQAAFDRAARRQPVR